jgi:hypothetical protein
MLKKTKMLEAELNGLFWELDRPEFEWKCGHQAWLK